VSWSPPAWLGLGVRRWSLADLASGYLLAARLSPTEDVDVAVGLPLPVLSVDTAALRRRMRGRRGGDGS
jgi:hypothetical protein